MQARRCQHPLGLQLPSAIPIGPYRSLASAMANTYSNLANDYLAHHELESALTIMIGAALHMVEATCGVRGKSDVMTAYLDCHPNTLQQCFQ